MKVKVPVNICTIAKHTDTKALLPREIGSKAQQVEIEIDINDEVVKAFLALWPTNELEVTVSGHKVFKDGEHIA